MSHNFNTLFTKTDFNAMPIYDWSVQSEYVHTLVYWSMLQICRMEEFLESLQGEFIWGLNVSRCFLRDFELKNLPLFIGFVNIITSMKLVFNQRCSVLGSQAIWIFLLCLIRIWRADEFLPFLNWIFCLMAKQKYATFSAGQITH